MIKKGAGPGAIVYLIIAITSFVIIMVVLFVQIDLPGFTEDEVCRLSVLTRATSPEAAQRALPLRCTTEKICLSQTGEECAPFIGEANVANIKLPGNNEAAIEKIEEITALSIYECWNTMGQGKLNMFGGGKTPLESIGTALNLNDAKSTCVICDRIALANDITEKENEIINQVDVNSYLENNQAPGSSLTYLQVLTDQQVRSYPREFEQSLSQTQNVKPTDQIGIIFMQIATEETVLEAVTGTAQYTGAFLIGGTVGLAGIGSLVSLPVVITSAVTTAGASTIAAFQTYQNRQVSLGFCGEFTSSDEAVNGCSIVTGFNYNDIEKLNNYCGRIEGKP